MTFLLLLSASILVVAHARPFGIQLNWKSHDEYTRKNNEQHPDYTLTCYEHTLQNAASIDAHRYRPDGSPDYAMSFRFPVSHLEYAEIALLEVRKIELDEISGDNCSDAQRETGDAFRLAWSEYVGWPSWAQLPMPCGVDHEQSFGVSVHSHIDWGKKPTTQTSGHVYRAHGGKQSPDAIVVRLNEEHREHPERLQSFVLTAYMRSRAPLRVRSLQVRKCLIEPPSPAPIEAMRSVAAANRAAEDVALALQLQSMPVALTVDELAPRLLPLRSVVWAETSTGSCFVDLGWINSWPYAVNASDCHSGNCLQPAVVDEYVIMPTSFAPGWHRNRTRVPWTCRGWRPGLWNTLRWTLGNGVVQIDHTTPITHSRRLPWSEEDWDDKSPVESLMHIDGNLVAHQINTQIDYWRLAHNQEIQPEINMENLITSACAFSKYDCTADDDSKDTLDALLAIALVVTFGIIVVIVIFIVALVFDIPLDPIKLLYLVALIALVGVGLIGFNFMFAPRLNRPNGVERPGSLFDLAGVDTPVLGDLSPAGVLPDVPDSPNIDLPASDIPSGSFGGNIPPV